MHGPRLKSDRYITAAYLTMHWSRQGASQIEHTSLRHRLQGNLKGFSFRSRCIIDSTTTNLFSPSPGKPAFEKGKVLGLAQAPDTRKSQGEYEDPDAAPSDHLQTWHSP